MADEEQQEESGGDGWVAAQALCNEIIALVAREESHAIVLAAMAGAAGIVLDAVRHAYDADFYDTFINHVKIAMEDGVRLMEPKKENKSDRQTKNATKGIPPSPYRHRHSSR